MEKDSYSLDEILSEVKKRREERTKTSTSTEEAIPKQKSKTENKPKTDNSGEKIKPQASKKEAKPAEKTEKKTENRETPKKSEAAENKKNSEITETSSVKKVSAAQQMNKQMRQSRQKKDTDASMQSVSAEQIKTPEKQETKKAEEKEEFVDILSFSNTASEDIAAEADIKSNKKKEKFFKTKKGKTVKALIIILVLIVAAVGIYGGIYVYRALNEITDNADTPQQVEQWQGMSERSENFPEITETEATQLYSLQDMIKTWYYNGAPASSSHVLNVLLIGEDTRGSEVLEEDTRADSAIIVSLNADTKRITLTSILRDTYAYWENEPGNEATGEFGKINGAMMSGIGTYINCVEKMYKIDIDNYAIVNFDSFKGIIDALGGVSLELTDAEINEINTHPSRYGNVTIEKTFDGDSGVLELNGEQALAYCRIRYIDSDNARADRQKTCLNQIFKQVREGSTVTLLKVVDQLIPYVKTGFGSSEIISIAKYALSQGWLNFEMVTTNVPFSRINESGSGGEYYGSWCWKADFPQDANYLQTLIYGKSSITLAQDRVDILNCNEYGFYSETLTPTWAVIHNDAYGEVTTYESSKEEDNTQTTQ